MGFSQQEYWSGLPLPSPGDLPHPGIEPSSLALAGILYCSATREAWQWNIQFSSVAQLCLTLCDLMDCGMPGFPVHHHRTLEMLSPRLKVLKISTEWKTLNFYVFLCWQRQAEFECRNSTGLGNIETQLLVGAHKISRALGPSTKKYLYRNLG